MLALTHAPSPKMAACELTYIPRVPIDYPRALEQHAAYCQMLRRSGAEVITLDVNRDFADGAFIEDTAVVLDEVAILASMGSISRRPEPAGIESALGQYRPVQRIDLPATLEGGDVLRIGQTLLVGLSSRTNLAGVRALDAIVRPLGYRVIPVPVHGCLHLKTACSALPDGQLLLNPAWIDLEAIRGFRWHEVPESEPWAANVALVGDRVFVAAGHELTASLIQRLGFEIETIDLTEFAKAEAGVTCLSILDRRG